MPLPCRRVLQDRLKHIKFSPGVLYEYYAMLPHKVCHMSPLQSEAMAAFDEMALKPALVPDVSTNTYIGKCTLPARKTPITQEMRLKFNNDSNLIEAERTRISFAELDTPATKAVVVLLGGIESRWKFTAGYHFIGSSVCPLAMKAFITEILQKSHDSGLLVRTLVSDMGNRAVWTAFGIDVGPAAATFWVPHPIRPDLKLYVMPDTVHVFKNTVEMLRSNGQITIALHLVQRFHLPTNEVKLDHLSALCTYQENFRWKLAPGLTQDLLKVKHFAKMRVGNSSKVFNARVAAALTFLSYTSSGEPGMRTTAWFISVFSRWFEIMTARTPLHGLGKKSPEAFANAIDTLHVVLDLFQTMKVGNGNWKPCQTGVKAATLCVLDLVKVYLDEVGLEFLLVGRLTSDLCENFFSCIRYLNPIPSALQFKQRLRCLSMCQFMKHVPKSSYDLDDRTELLELLHAENMTVPEDLLLPQLFSLDEDEDDVLAGLSAGLKCGRLEGLPENEKAVFYRVCGYILHKLMEERRSSLSECIRCLNACVHSAQEPHKYGNLSRLTNYKDGALVEVSDAVFTLLQSVEELVTAVEPSLDHLKSDVIQFLEEKVCSVEIPRELQLECHANLAKNIIHRYLQFRFKYQPAKSVGKASRNASAEYSSFSVGSRSLAAQFDPSRKKLKAY